jgi:hypothetical protein
MASSIQILRSTIFRERPFPGNLLEGQPAINLNSSEPGLFFRTSDGSLVKIGPAAITFDGFPPNSNPVGSQGHTVGEFWFDASIPPGTLRIFNGSSWIGTGNPFSVETVNAGVGIAASRVGNNVTVSNTGILDISPGAGIDVSTGSGLSTISNSGVTQLIAGPNIALSASTGAVTISSTGGGGGGATLTRWTIQASAGQTILSGTDPSGTALVYTPGQEQVFINGALMTRDVDYTATTGTTIAMSFTLTAGDEVVVLILASGGGGGGGSATLLRWTVAAIAGQSTLSGSDQSGQPLAYTAGFEQVFVNGALLTRGSDYTATNGSSITVSPPLAAADEVVVLAFSPLSASSVDTANLQDGSVTNIKLANNAVTSAKIADDTIVNADINANAAIASTKSSSQLNLPNATLRALSSKLKDVVSVTDFGADPTGATNSTAAIQNAIDSGAETIFFPEGKYSLFAPLIIKSFVTLVGPDLGESNTGTNEKKGHAKLIWEGGSGFACVTTASPTTAYGFGGFMGLTFMTNVASYQYIFDLPAMNACHWVSVTAGNNNPNGGVLRVVPNNINPPWINYLTNCEFGLSDFATGYIIDWVCSDSFIIGCYFSGGQGVIDRATGGNNYVGCHFDRVYTVSPTAAAITFKRDLVLHDDENTKNTCLVGCYLDENASHGVLFDNTGSTVPNTYFRTVISACTFRGVNASYISDIRFNAVGVPVKGVSVVGCSFSNDTNKPPFTWDDPTLWTECSLVGNTASGADFMDFTQPNSMVIDARFGCLLPKLRATGNQTYFGLTNVSGIFSAQNTPATSCLLLGSENGNAPFVAAGRNDSADPSNLSLKTDNTTRLRINTTGSVRFVPLAAAPASPSSGDVYFDSVLGKLRCWDGSVWNDLF